MIMIFQDQAHNHKVDVFVKMKKMDHSDNYLVLTGLALIGEAVLVFLRGGRPFGLLLFVNILKEENLRN